MPIGVDSGFWCPQYIKDTVLEIRASERKESCKIEDKFFQIGEALAEDGDIPQGFAVLLDGTFSANFQGYAFTEHGETWEGFFWTDIKTREVICIYLARPAGGNALAAESNLKQFKLNWK
ncbi:hypothetical protein [Candidatus Cryosericum terrychapinii]|uniref:Uncharacterized protein n=1 Tax=Candidatus Cryosericum terrychapinii TaxID=2290919 RepID=A0A398CTS3_9BACT|nr:hypothetical protein [Candidatus Cryosericum terrychapinii]RIE06796.1 hypothetical protein SMC7_00680 [Candidatus Cryosericum terrychapinii]